MKKNNLTKHIISVIFLSSILINPVYTQSKFKLSTEKELITLSLGGISTITSLLINKNYNVSLNEINSLDKNSINKIDRSAINYYSPDLSLVSDVLLVSTLSLPLTFLFFDETQTDLKTIGIMYLETIAITNGLTNLTKNLTQRFRPYAYNSSVPMDKKLDSDTKKSFFSGHTSIAFASAVFFSTVFSESKSNEKLNNYVWIGSLSLAGSVGLLRYFSGKHFPSDIIAGALVGSLIGYAIPKIHKESSNFALTTNNNQNLISFRYYLK